MRKSLEAILARESAVRVRIALLDQEIERLTRKIAHYDGRIQRGSADDEDRAAFEAYTRMRSALRSLKI